MRLRWLYLSLLLILSVILSVQLQAQQSHESHVGSLPPQSHKTGWVRLFDGLSTFGWIADGRGAWTVEEGALASPTINASPIHTTTLFGDFEIQLEYRLDKASNANLLLRCPNGKPSEQNAYAIKLTNSQPEAITWHRINIHAQGNLISVSSLNSEYTIVNNSHSAQGAINLTPGKGRVWFRDLRLRPINTHPLFDGKSLTGWHPLPDQKASFEVTPEGLIHASSGAGELQTTAKWNAFIFQCEVRTNSPHAQGGLLFRAQPDQFGNGYEDHIRNEWQNIDHSKPIDYGTGGIYLLQAVREVVSADAEWTSLTLAVEGNHIASWVNGYQVADYTDTRPPNASDARKGAHAAEGCIALILHNAASDISFRNLRIESLDDTDQTVHQPQSLPR